MATKNLSRTVIEGGRYRRNRWDRRHSNKQARVVANATFAQTRRDPENDNADPPCRKPVGKWFRDKLGPARRWLGRQVGRPWNAVRSDIFTRFDIRSTPGRHIVFGHLLPWVDDGDRHGFAWSEFTVDRHGILRNIVRPPRHVTDDQRRYVPANRALEIENWLDGRLVAVRGDALFWCVATPFGAFRQDQRLAESDVAFWREIPQWLRNERTVKT